MFLLGRPSCFDPVLKAPRFSAWFSAFRTSGQHCHLDVVFCLSYGSGYMAFSVCAKRVLFFCWFRCVSLGLSDVVLSRQQRVGQEGFGDCSAEIITVGETVSPAKKTALCGLTCFHAGMVS